jgi:two-component system cell cycle sensor histidine kinase/response regulator CckA
VLVAEDDDAVRSLLCRVLSSHGYAVLEGRDGEEAAAVAQAHPGRIHLLVTDLGMPRALGKALAERLAAARPGLKVLFVSARPHEVAQDLVRPGETLLRKPFGEETLLREVARALASS